MKKFRNVTAVLALAGWFALASTTARAQFAGNIVSYLPGTGFAAGFTNASSALGSPALGSGITPFAPPFSKSQLVSIGAGGEITLQMDTPIINDPGDPFGLNFIIFANSFFVQNGGSGQTATTSGALFFHSASTLIQVSPDNVNWYTLNPALAPQPGEWFPTYGGGNPLLPANPALATTNFAGMTLAQVESLYGGSAGGTGFSLSWAQDSSGNSVDLANADYVRVEVQSGVLDMDAVSAVPEPGTWALILAGGAILWFWSAAADLRRLLQKIKHPFIALGLFFICCTTHANTITEDFSTNPLQNGWAIFGDTNLFQWDSTNHDLAVTWDSSQTNSYFYRSLGTILATDNDFNVEFDINLSSATTTNYGSELAVGFLNLADATSINFLRTQGTSPNVAEFDYFPPSNIAPSIDATLVDASNDFYFVYDNLPLNPGTVYHIRIAHAAGDQTITGEVFTNGVLFTALPKPPFGSAPADFRLDTIAVSSYQDDGFDNSIFAQGRIANLVITVPPPPVQNIAGAFNSGHWQVQFTSQTNWLYTLQRSPDLFSWVDISATAPGIAGTLSLSDTNDLPSQAFYRVRAQRP